MWNVSINTFFSISIGGEPPPPPPAPSLAMYSTVIQDRVKSKILLTCLQGK